MTDEKEPIPVERHGIAREFVDFIIHNKLWWMTPKKMPKRIFASATCYELLLSFLEPIVSVQQIECVKILHQ